MAGTRVLCTQYPARVTTDHKPGLFENSLSNKGQLSAWRLLETVDLLSIVENLYRTGGKMLLADLLSRICAPSDGFWLIFCLGSAHPVMGSTMWSCLRKFMLFCSICRKKWQCARQCGSPLTKTLQRWLEWFKNG